MKLLRRVRGIHHDEQGAIALLALAGILITFMTALVLYDAGFAVRHKFKAQISADAAAYSQAAIKGRVMNDIAYVNVVKRTMLGVWAMYVGMMYQFYREVVGDVICAMSTTHDLRFLSFFSGDGSRETLQRFRQYRDELNANCNGATDQYEVFWHEAFGDWLRFSNPTSVADITDVADPRADHQSAFTWEYRSASADFYRDNIDRLATMQRLLVETTPKWAKVEGAVRARASGAEKVDTVLSALPTRLGVPTQICLKGTAHLDGSIASGSELEREVKANRDAHARRSDPESKFKQGANLSAGLQQMGDVGCPSLLANFEATSMSPWIPTRDEAQDFVNTGRLTPFEDYRREHFEFLRPSHDLGHPEVAEYEGVSCGEIVDLAPQFRGFRASWAPRVAPVGKCVPANAGWWK